MAIEEEDYRRRSYQSLNPKSGVEVLLEIGINYPTHKIDSIDDPIS